MMQFLVVQSEFSAAHFYKNADFTEAKNRKTFGRCFTNYGHGHNYKVELGVATKKKNKAESILKEITKKLDHEHLNFEIPEFKETVPTTENILLYIEKKLEKTVLKNSLVFIRLFEMDDLWSEKYYVTV